MGKKTNINPQAFIKEQTGVSIGDALERQTRKQINPVKIIDPYKEANKRAWSDRDLQDNTSRYAWSGSLPIGLTSWNIERMLYFRFVLGCVEGDNGEPVILPFYSNKPLNCYGMPTEGRIINFSGTRSPDNEKDFVFYNNKTYEVFQQQPDDENLDLTKLKDKNTMILLFDRVPNGNTFINANRYSLNQTYINQIADCMSKVQTNLTISSPKTFVIAKDPNAKDEVMQQINMAFQNNFPYIVVNSMFDMEHVQSTTDLQASELFNAVKQYDDIRLQQSAIETSSFGTFKKERNINADIENDNNATDMQIDTCLLMRDSFAKLYSLKFDRNLSVDYRFTKKESKEDKPEEESEE